MKATLVIGVVIGLALPSLARAQSDPAPDDTKSPPPAATPADEGKAKDEPGKETPPAEEKKPEAAKPAPVEDSHADEGFPSDLLGYSVHGRFALKYRGRWEVSKDGRDSDQDLYQELSADIGNARKDTLTAHFSLRASEDVDGESSSQRYHVFDSLEDTYRHRAHGDLYYAHADLHRLLFVDLVRAGRQSLDELPWVTYFDGVRVDTMAWEKVLNLQAGGYAGIPVHYYESSWRGDAIYGAWVQAKPWKGGRFRAEYTRIRDAYRGITSRDDLWTLSAWQQLFDMLTLSGRYSILDGIPRDHNLRADFYVPDWDFRISAGWYRLYREQNLQAIDEDYFFWTLHSYFPYDQFTLLAAKGFGKHVYIQAGGDMREVSPYDDEGPGNRSFQRYFLSPGLTDWPLKGLSASVTLEYWNVKHTQSGDTKSFGFDVTYKPVKFFKVSVGSNFALYKYDVFDDTEREHVQTYYARVSVSPWKPLKFDLGYELEHNDHDDFHKAKFGVSYSF